MRKGTAMGHALQGPRITPRSLWLAGLWLAGPALGVVALADLLGSWLARLLWDTCFGVACWL